MMVALLLVLLATVFAANSRRVRLSSGTPGSKSDIRRGYKPRRNLLRSEGGAAALAQQVKESIGFDRLLETVDFLLSQPEEIVSDQYRFQLIHLRGGICAVENEKRMGMIAIEAYIICRNQQRFSLLHLCKEIFSVTKPAYE